MSFRYLNAAEKTMLSTIYGSSYDFSNVKIYNEGLPGQTPGRATTPDGNTYYSAGSGYAADFSSGSVSLADKATFIHEMMHVVQKLSGVPVGAQWAAENVIHLFGDTYDYSAIFNGTSFSDLTLEAQAKFMEDFYKLQNGGATSSYGAGKNINDFRPHLPIDFPNSTNPNAADDYDPNITPSPYSTPGSLGPNSQLGWSLPAKGMWCKAPDVQSPLVLDLDGDGIEVTKMGYSIGRSEVYFDLNNDGFAERTGWVDGGDGLLAWDRNANGQIDNQSELFGNSSIYADGFANCPTPYK